MGILERDLWTDYEWIVVLGALSCLAMAWSIGANDVANSFATSVGSKTLTLWQACIVAGIFEFVGAIALGGVTAKTIAGSIALPEYFYEVPEIFAYGMLCALVSAATWVTIATYKEMAVSTTHSIVGAVLGFALVYGGKDAVIWQETIDEFPYRKGFVTIIMSWFIAPTLAGGLAAIIFNLNRFIVLRREGSANKAIWALPILVFVTVFINLFFVFFKGASKELAWDANKSAWVAAAVAGGCSLLMVPVCIWLKGYHHRKHDRMEAEEAAAAKALENPDLELQAKQKAEKDAADAVEVEKEANRSAATKYMRALSKGLTKGLTVDVHEDVHLDEKVAAMHASMEIFEVRTEGVYKYLQVFSACCVAFAHGSNDVANAVGPFTAIWMVYNTYKVSSSYDMPRWILVLGAFGLVVGLGTYGYNIIKVIGVNLASMTPSRGFSAELATGLTISLASVYGIPVSTTQIIVGAEIGVGLCEGLKGANMKLFFKTFLGWIFTIIFAAFVSGALFAFGIYAPSKPQTDHISDYQAALRIQMTDQIKALNASNIAANRTVPGRYNSGLNANITNLNRNISSLFNFKSNGHINRNDFIEVLTNVTWLYNNNTVPVVGYSKARLNLTAEAIVVPAN